MTVERLTGPRVALVAVLLFAALLGARGISDESSGMLGFDMARYMMDGVFVRDLAASGGAWSPGDLADRAERYYARYPALSVGHHPPLPYVALAPFYFVFGVSMLAARLAAVTWFVLATWWMFTLARRLLGWQAATWAALLFVTNTMVLRAGQYVVSEMPMLALVLASVNALLRYCDRRRAVDLFWFVVAAVASLYAKQLAILMLPVYAYVLVSRLGWRALLTRHVALASVLAIVLVAPLAVMTLTLSRANLQLTAYNISGLTSGGTRMASLNIFGRMIGGHLSLPMLIAVVAGGLALILQRRREGLLALVWLVAIIGGTFIFTAGFEPARYAFAVLPAYFVLAAGLASWTAPSPLRWVALPVLVAALGWQAWEIRHVRPSGAGGYEAAAEFVVKESRQPVVLYDSFIDTGYFVFFTRKHDIDRRMMIVRADKLLTAPRDDKGAKSKYDDPAPVFALLNEMGVQLIVVEERSRGPAVLRMLHAMLKTDRFVLRQRLPIDSREPEAAGVNLAIYEYKDARPPDLDAPLHIDLPMGNRKINLTLRDILGSR